MKQAKKQQQPAQVVTQMQDADTNISSQGEEFDDEPAFNEIDKLETLGINTADINKLKSVGLCTVLSVLMW